MLAQLCAKLSHVSDDLKQMYLKYGSTRQTAATHEFMAVMKDITTTSNFRSLYLVFDALDECPKGEKRHELLDLITEIRSWPSSKCHLLVTSREEVDIKQVLTPLLTAPAMLI